MDTPPENSRGDCQPLPHPRFRHLWLIFQYGYRVRRHLRGFFFLRQVPGFKIAILILLNETKTSNMRLLTSDSLYLIILCSVHCSMKLCAEKFKDNDYRGV